jgi:hypothetical protein
LAGDCPQAGIAAAAGSARISLPRGGIGIRQARPAKATKIDFFHVLFSIILVATGFSRNVCAMAHDIPPPGNGPAESASQTAAKTLVA